MNLNATRTRQLDYSHLPVSVLFQGYYPLSCQANRGRQQSRNTEVRLRERDRNRNVEVERIAGAFVGDEWPAMGAGISKSDTPHYFCLLLLFSKTPMTPTTLVPAQENFFKVLHAHNPIFKFKHF